MIKDKRPIEAFFLGFGPRIREIIASCENEEQFETAINYVRVGLKNYCKSWYEYKGEEFLKEYREKYYKTLKCKGKQLKIKF